MEWIKCSDRMPKTEGNLCTEDVCLVVVYEPNNEIRHKAPKVSRNYFFEKCPEWNQTTGEYVGSSDFKWCYYDSIDDIPIGDDHAFVTHWMPYPEPPTN